MRVIVTGDKSRYQFLRFLVNSENLDLNDTLFTERLSEINVFVSSENNGSNTNTYYSTILPLNSIICFPSEYGDQEPLHSEDKVIFFNEFPYNREEDMEKLNDIIESGIYGQLCVVFVENNRDGIDSDISSNEMAISSAKKIFDDKKITYCDYSMGKRPEFLYWMVENQKNLDASLIVPMLKRTRQEIEVFDTTYDLLYEIDLSMMIDDPNNRKLILSYDRSVNNKNVWQEYSKRSVKLFLSGEQKVVTFYSDIYKKTISSIAIWNIDKDIHNLSKVIKEALECKFAQQERLIFSGKEEAYEVFLNENKVIYVLSKILLEFFKEELKVILKTRIVRDVEIMEGLLDGYDC